MKWLKALRLLAASGVLLIAPLGLFAMSVLPPSFSELVDEATRIVRGTVVSVVPFEEALADGQKVVKTRVTWKLDRTLKGPARSEMSLDFLGGELPHLATEVPGMPRFRVGQTDYLFLGRNEKALCPVIAGEHGRFPVRFEAGSGQTFVSHAVRGSRLLERVDGAATRADTRAAAGVASTELTTVSFEASVQSQLRGEARP